MSRVTRGIQTAAEAASFSVRSRYRTGAALYFGSRLVSVGYNNYRTNPKQLVRFRWEHAETNCLIGTNRHDLSTAILYVARADDSGKLKMAKPCADCQRLLGLVGLKRVWHTNASGHPEKFIVGA